MRIIFALILLLPVAASASCFPENTLKVPLSHDIQANAITKAAFNEAIDKVYNYYAPIVKAKGYELVFNRAWEDGTVNSDTYVSGKQWVIDSYGGLARYAGMNTVAAYAEVACHELGHHMGGAPRYSGDWASVEGEADYWGSKECMKAIGFSTRTARAAGDGLGKILADLGGENTPTATTPDMKVVALTFEEHPEAQCRFDTYRSALKCGVHGDQSPTDPKVNNCYDYPTSTTYSIGSRPRCWFAP